MKTRENGWIYFIQEGGEDGPIKIGFANDIYKRLKQLQSGNPRKLTLLASTKGDSNLEAMLHRCHRRDRIRGEWFEATGDVRRAVETARYYNEQDIKRWERGIVDERDAVTDLQTWLIFNKAARRPGYRPRPPRLLVIRALVIFRQSEPEITVEQMLERLKVSYV